MWRVAFAPDNRTVLTGTVRPDALSAWDAVTGRLRWRVVFATPRWDDDTVRFTWPRDVGFETASAPRLVDASVRRVGRDWLMTGRLAYGVHGDRGRNRPRA